MSGSQDADDTTLAGLAAAYLDLWEANLSEIARLGPAAPADDGAAGI